MPQIEIPGDVQDVSDGYHSFRELYQHRCTLFAALCQAYASRAWRAKLHHDGTGFDGWFIAGLAVPLPGGDKHITYHLPMSDWHLFDDVYDTRERAPEWDGHTAEDVVQRLRSWIEGKPLPAAG